MKEEIKPDNCQECGKKVENKDELSPIDKTYDYKIPIKSFKEIKDKNKKYLCISCLMKWKKENNIGW